MMGRSKSGHPLVKLAAARARPISKQTLFATGWSAKPSKPKKRKACPQQGMTAAIHQKAKPMAETRLITQKDLEAERAAGEERARERQALAKIKVAARERAFKKRLEEAPAAGKQRPKRTKRR